VPRTSHLDIQLLQSRQRLSQAGAAPIEHMVVGQYAAVDLGVSKTRGIFGTHAIIDTLLHAIIAAGHRRFQVDDTRIRLHPRQLLQCSAPRRRMVRFAAE
jgi:hypothetical protein